MRIGIYVEVAKDAKPTGIGLHVRNLLNALAAIDSDNEYLLYYQRNIWRSGAPFPHRPAAANFKNRPVRFPNTWHWNRPRLWWQWYLPRVLRKDRLDIFHGPNHFVADWNRSRTIVTIHDVAYFRMDVHPGRQNEFYRHWTRMAFDHSAAVIALSENTRRDVEELGVEPSRVHVIYGGGHVVPEAQIQYHRLAEMRAQFRLPEKYILFVGSLMPRKNVPFLVRSYARLKQTTDLPHKLVLAGHRDNAAAEIEHLAHKLGIHEDVIVTGYVDDWHLPLLYKQADLFVLPTLYEGFTLVTLEAMAYGTPTIATDTSSIREGVGDAALLVPVNDDEALASAMHRALTDTALRQRLIPQGKEQAKKFTWERCARETLALYEQIHQQAQESPAAPSLPVRSA